MADRSDGTHSHADHSPQITFQEKAVKLIEHWIQHNNDHADNYMKWRTQFIENGLGDLAELLLSAAELTGQINRILAKAAEQLPTK